MANPGGKYPGRQIFLGALKTGKPAFAYFVSGRSQASQRRYATPFIEAENAVRIRPVDTQERFDPFRHYQAVKIDPDTGLAVVSNSQAPVDPVFEAYKFMEEKNAKFLAGLLRAIGPEYDNKENPTPRIMGVFIPTNESGIGMLSITTGKGTTAIEFDCEPYFGLSHVQTYDGNVNYRAFDPNAVKRNHLPGFRPVSTTARQLADEIYEMSDYTDPQYGELRVCAVAGVRSGKGPGGWELARRNRHDVE